MTKDEYKAFLKQGIQNLEEIIEGGGFGNPTATAMIICERNRLVEKLYDFECKNVIGGDHHDCER